MNTRKLSRYLSNWCKANGFDVGVRYGKDFAYYFTKDYVQYTFLVVDRQEELFQKVFADEGLDYTCDIFITSFFHELGHYCTDDNWSEKQSLKFMEKKAKLDGESDKDNMEYFYMPDEIMATRWAVDYINANPTKVEEFWQGAQERIMEIYEEVQSN